MPNPRAQAADFKQLHAVAECMEVSEVFHIVYTSTEWCHACTFGWVWVIFSCM